MTYKRKLYSAKPGSDNIDPIYSIKPYNSNYQYDKLEKQYKTTPIGISEPIHYSDVDNDNILGISTKKINSTELKYYNTINSIKKNLRYGYNNDETNKYGIDELLLIGKALNINLPARIKQYNASAYFIKTLQDWKNSSKFENIYYGKSLIIINDLPYFNIPAVKTHLFVSQAETEIFCTIRGIEIKYTHHYDKVLDAHFYILPPDIFKYTAIFDEITNTRINHLYKHVENGVTTYPIVKYFSSSTSEDIKTLLPGNKIHSLNSIPLTQ